MTETTVYLQPAFILQQRNYRETSLIIDVITRDFGWISILAKGVRTAKSKTAGMLQPFIPLVVSYAGKGELKILTDAERYPISLQVCQLHNFSVDKIQSFKELKGLGIYCGFYLNELIVCFLHKYDPHPEVFDDYRDCLFCLANCVNLEAALRLFELKLLECTGYGLQFDLDSLGKSVDPLKKYQYIVGQGAIETREGYLSGSTLLALNKQILTDSQVLSEAKTLMRRVIDFYLQGKPLKSRAVISKIMSIAQ
ncbi:MAG: recombination protein O N-terminal domain-containing protein [Methylobacter sp.]|nr:recombination protein O N-terminal domain-containing protein [Methylobacter sp.]